MKKSQMFTIEDNSEDAFQQQYNVTQTLINTQQFDYLFEKRNSSVDKIQDDLHSEDLADPPSSNKIFALNHSEDNSFNNNDDLTLQAIYSFENIQHNLHQATSDQRETTNKINNILTKLIEPLIRKSFKDKDQPSNEIESEFTFGRISFDDMLETSDNLLDSRINSCAQFQKIQLPNFKELK